MQAEGKYDIDTSERNNGAEYIRLLVACSVGQRLSLVFYIIGVVICFVAGFYSPYLLFAGFGVGAIGVSVGVIGLVRSSQAEKARKEFQQTIPLGPD